MTLPVMWRRTLFLAAAVLCAVRSPVLAQEPGPVWAKLTDAQRDEVVRFGDDYKQFIGRAKSELTFVREAVRLVEANGFRPSPAAPGTPFRADLRPGSRWYAINRDRTIVAFVLGTDPVVTGARIVNTHNDSVHLTLKPNPFRESVWISLFDTAVHGGIKNYQWVNRPLALVGRVTKTDGSVVTVDIGHQPGDPVLIVPDIAPHIDQDFRQRQNRDVIQTEELDPVLALTAEAAMTALRTKYGLVREDFLAADLQIVPAQMPVDVGLDQQLIGAFGHDDRSNGFASFRAIVEVRTPRKTAI